MVPFSDSLKGWFKSLIGVLSVSSGLHRRLLSGFGVVLTFHRVNDQKTPDGLTCSRDVFAEYCRFFRKYFHVVSLGNIVDKLERKTPLCGELAITLDDGYLDNYENAAPILKSVDLPAIFFLATGFIGSEHVPWWDVRKGVSYPWMTWDHVRALQEDGFEIGSHTRSHADMGTISVQEAMEEIVGACRDIGMNLDVMAEHFAFPYGHALNMNEENRSIVRRLGLRCCCSLEGIVGTGTDPFDLPRIPINEWYASPYHLVGDLVIRALRRRNRLAFNGYSRNP